MNNRMRMAVLIFAVLTLSRSPEVFALVSVNEFLADPPDGLLGDANRDGVRNGSDDEFVELLNETPTGVDLSHWSLWDKLQARHQFTSGIFLPPHDRVVIFGGGHPSGFTGMVFTASSGTLSLNNSGDEIVLKDSAGAVVDQIFFGNEGNLNQSLSRFPEGSGPFQLHTLVSSRGVRFSPGTDPEGGDSARAVTTPEPATPILLIQGFLFLSIVIRRRCFVKIGV